MKKHHRPNRKNKQEKKIHWWNKIGSYRVFGIPIGSWLALIILLSCLSILLYFIIIQPIMEPYESEVFTAEIRDLWTEQYYDKTGVGMIYRVRLSRDNEEEFTCTVPQIFIKIWQQLEKEKHYEFEVSRSTTRCYINKATEIETKDLFGVEDK